MIIPEFRSGGITALQKRHTTGNLIIQVLRKRDQTRNRWWTGTGHFGCPLSRSAVRRSWQTGVQKKTSGAQKNHWIYSFELILLRGCVGRKKGARPGRNREPSFIPRIVRTYVAVRVRETRFSWFRRWFVTHCSPRAGSRSTPSLVWEGQPEDSTKNSTIELMAIDLPIAGCKTRLRAPDRNSSCAPDRVYLRHRISLGRKQPETLVGTVAKCATDSCAHLEYILLHH